MRQVSSLLLQYFWFRSKTLLFFFFFSLFLAVELEFHAALGYQSFSCTYQDTRFSKHPCQKLILEQSSGISHSPRQVTFLTASSTRLRLINMLKRSCHVTVAKGILWKATSNKSCGENLLTNPNTLTVLLCRKAKLLAGTELA